jgi:hypothetical protein
MILGLVVGPGEYQTGGMKKKPKTKTKSVKKSSREDTNQIAHRVMQEIIKKSES